jgi:hypothetical protein
MRVNLLVRHGILIFCIATQSAACMGWRVQELAPAEVIAREHPKQIRVERLNGHRDVLYRPEIQGDTLRGSRDPNVRQRDRVILLRDVRSVATLHVKTAETVAVGLVLAGVAAAIIALAVTASRYQ